MSKYDLWKESGPVDALTAAESEHKDTEPDWDAMNDARRDLAYDRQEAGLE